MTGEQFLAEVKSVLYNNRPNPTEYLVALLQIEDMIKALIRVTRREIEDEGRDIKWGEDPEGDGA